MNLIEEFQIHEHLNPKLWDDAGMLRPEVKEKIVEIVNHFEESLQLPIFILDIQLVGSNASYNYTDTSDLDVHIIANFDQVDANREVLEAAYNMKKSSFNKDHDISIHGVEVELYIQDVNSNITSNGIYSVCEDRWIKEPKPIKSITKHNTEKELEKWRQHIAAVIKSNNYDTILNCVNALYLVRHNSLAVDGEYGKGNALFKDIRSAGLLDALKEALLKAESKKLSLESFNEGQIVHRYID